MTRKAEERKRISQTFQNALRPSKYFWPSALYCFHSRKEKPHQKKIEMT